VCERERGGGRERAVGVFDFRPQQAGEGNPPPSEAPPPTYPGYPIVTDVNAEWLVPSRDGDRRPTCTRRPLRNTAGRQLRLGSTPCRWQITRSATSAHMTHTRPPAASRALAPRSRWTSPKASLKAARRREAEMVAQETATTDEDDDGDFGGATGAPHGGPDGGDPPAGSASNPIEG